MYNKLSTCRPNSSILQQPLRDATGAAPGLRPGVFVDRDGTLNIEHGYLREPSLVELLPHAAEAIALLNAAAIPVIIITNQSGIGRGLITLAEFDAVNQALWDALQHEGAYYDALYYCPHDPTIEPRCFCRKPQPGLLLQAAADLGLDLARSFLIGDKVSDVLAGRSAGSRSVLVLTGFGELARQQLATGNARPDHIAKDLFAATLFVRNCLLQA